MTADYEIDLFYDIPFTNDYSNVLHFDTKIDRDTFFRAYDKKIVVMDNEINRIMVDGGSVKMCITAELIRDENGYNRIDDFNDINYM